MYNCLSLQIGPLSSIRPSIRLSIRLRSLNLLTVLCVGLAAGWMLPAKAQMPSRTTPAARSTQLTQASPPPPTELTTALSQIDAAASQEDLRGVMRFYDRAFTSSDGLTRSTLEQALSALWKRYPDLTYSTTLESWEPQADGLSTVTTTTITGSYPDQRRDLKLKATITARQQFRDNQIVQQEILSERSELTSGEQPPTVEVVLPEQVAPGQAFDFDAVVTEPLGERVLLGAALEEPVNPDNYLNPSPIELELLTSGGLFKVGQVPKDEKGDRWISAVIVRYDGITAVTQRLRVNSQ